MTFSNKPISKQLAENAGSICECMNEAINKCSFSCVAFGQETFLNCSVPYSPCLPFTKLELKEALPHLSGLLQGSKTIQTITHLHKHK